MPEEGKTDSESSCSFFGKRKAVIRKNEFRLQKIRLETSRRGRPLFVLRTFFPFHRENSQVRMTRKAEWVGMTKKTYLLSRIDKKGGAE